MSDKLKVHNPEGMSRHDISVETERNYIYADGSIFTMSEPKTLFLKRDEHGDSHRVVTKDGWTHYPRRGWIGIRWLAPSENVSF